MIEKLTPEQEARIEVKKDTWLRKIFNYEQLRDFNPERAGNAMKAVYRLSELDDNIDVYICSSPREAVLSYREVTGQKNENPSWGFYVGAVDFGWVSFYEYFLEEFPDIISEDVKEKFLIVVEAANAGIFMSIQMDKAVWIVKPPALIERDEELRLHSVTGPALQFEDGYSMYFVHGREVEPEIFEAIESPELARTVFKNSQDNEDLKSVIATIVKDRWGTEALLQMLEAQLYKHEHIVHSPTYEEDLYLYRTKEKFQLSNSKGEIGEYPYAWLQYTCPSTGTVYLIDTYPDYESPLEAAKFHRPAEVPFEVPYDWNLFAN